MRGALPWKTDILEGDSYQIGQRELIPVVKMRSIIRRQVTFGTHNSSGYGGGLVWLKPLAVIERKPDGSEHCIAVVDETGTAITGMLIGALALPIIYAIVAGLASIWRRQRATA
jgi:hypothetical protein